MFEAQQLAVGCRGLGGRSRTQTVATAGGGGHTFVELKHYCSIKHVWLSLSLLSALQPTNLFDLYVSHISNFELDKRLPAFVCVRFELSLDHTVLLFFLISFTSLFFFFCFVSFIYLTPAALLICFFVVCGS